MLKTLDIVMIAIMLAGAAWTYQIKHQAEDIETELAAVERQIRAENDTIAILTADWTLLDQPSRLQGLYDVYHEELGLMSVRPDQVVGPDELPAQPVMVAPVGEETTETLASNIQGSVR